ncbi:Pentatricopeptide repeat-containing protein 5 [Yarrowia sp. C11]|nr:Pentatricopeptide repeat-containing protein 5 [Yarrowia sp. C11]
MWLEQRVVFKSFSRTSHLARNLFSSTGSTYHNNQNQPGFFVSTSTLHRHNSQLVCYPPGPSYNPNNDGNSAANLLPPHAVCLSAVTLNHNNASQRVSDEESLGEGSRLKLRRRQTLTKPAPVVYRRIQPASSAPPTKVVTVPSSKQLTKRQLATSATSSDYNSLYESLRALQVSETVEKSVTPPSSPRITAVQDDVDVNTLELPELMSDRYSMLSEASVEVKPPVLPIRRPGDVQFLPPIGISSVDDCAILDTPPASPLAKTVEAILTPASAPEASLNTLEDYNTELATLSRQTKSADSVTGVEQAVSDVLSLYQDLLTKHKPTIDTYTHVIVCLTTQAMKLAKWLKSPEYTQSKETLQVIGADKQRAQQLSKEFALLAAEIFFSSNAATMHKYSAGVYETLLKSGNHVLSSQHMIHIVEALERVGMTPTLSCYMSLMDHFSARQDYESMVAVYNSFKVTIGSTVSSNNLGKMYSKFIVGMYLCGESAAAQEFCETVSGDNELVRTVFSSAVEGLAAVGKVEEAWTMVQQFQLDNNVSVSIEASSKLLSVVCQQVYGMVSKKGKLALARDIYLYCASHKAFIGPATASFYQAAARSEYIDVMRNSVNMEALSEVAEELYVTATALDASTLFRFTSFFINHHHMKFALRFLCAQLEVARFSETTTNEIVNRIFGEVLRKRKELDAQELASLVSAFSHITISETSFASLVALLNMCWSRSSPISSLLEKSAAPLKCLEQFACLHMLWIKTASKTTNVAAVDELKARFGAVVDALMSQSCVFDQVFVSDIETTLKVLGMETGLFSKRQEQIRAKAETAEAVPTPPASPPSLEIDQVLSRKVIAFARSKAPSIPLALKTMGDAVAAGSILSVEAFLSVIEGASSKDTIRGAYAAAMDSVPHPSTSAAAWQHWEPIHRAVIVSGAAVDSHAASQAYQSLLAMGSHPCATAYGHLILNRVPLPSSTHDEAQDAVALFEEAVSHTQPTTFLFNIVLSKLSKARRFDSAMNIFAAMDKYPAKKTSVTYGTMISACCRAGNVADAERLFEEMELDPGYVARAAPYNTMNQYYIHTARDAAAAKRTFARMQEKGVQPTAHTFKLLIDLHTCCSIDIAAADSVLHMIEACGQQVTEHHLSSLLYARGVIMRDLPAAKAFYKNICTSRAVRPGTAIFQALIESYVANQRCHETPEVLEQMSRFGVPLTAYMTNSLIRGWAAQDFGKALGLFDAAYRNGKAEPSSYEAIIRACIYNGELQTASNILAMMRAASYPQPVVAKVHALLERVDQAQIEGWSYLMHNTFKSETIRI